MFRYRNLPCIYSIWKIERDEKKKKICDLGINKKQKTEIKPIPKVFYINPVEEIRKKDITRVIYVVIFLLYEQKIVSNPPLEIVSFYVQKQ